MSESLGTAAIDRLLTDTRAALDRMTRVDPSATPAAGTTGELPSATGTDESERVVATVSAPGRITALTMDPRVMRAGSEAVCDAVTEAVNAALATLQEAVLAELPTIDTGSLAADLERVQSESLASATSMFAALEDAMAGIQRRGQDR